MDGYTEAQRGRDTCPRSQTQAPAQGLVSDTWPTLPAFGREHHVITALTRWQSTWMSWSLQKSTKAPESTKFNATMWIRSHFTCRRPDFLDARSKNHSAGYLYLGKNLNTENWLSSFSAHINWPCSRIAWSLILEDTQQQIPKGLENLVGAKLKREIILSVSFVVYVYVCAYEKKMKRTFSHIFWCRNNYLWPMRSPWGKKTHYFHSLKINL